MAAHAGESKGTQITQREREVSYLFNVLAASTPNIALSLSITAAEILKARPTTRILITTCTLPFIAIDCEAQTSIGDDICLATRLTRKKKRGAGGSESEVPESRRRVLG